MLLSAQRVRSSAASRYGSTTLIDAHDECRSPSVERDDAVPACALFTRWYAQVAGAEPRL